MLPIMMTVGDAKSRMVVDAKKKRVYTNTTESGWMRRNLNKESKS